MINLIVFGSLSISFFPLVRMSSDSSIYSSNCTFNSSFNDKNIEILSKSFSKMSCDIESTKLNFKAFDKENFSDVMNITSFFNKERSDEIFEAIENVGFYFPNPLIDMINEYSSSPLMETMNKVMNKLNLPNEGIELNLYSNTFWKEFALIIGKKKFSSGSLFWNDLNKFLFRAIIHLKREEIINNVNGKLEESSKDINSIISLINQKLELQFIFDFKTMNIDDFDKDLLKTEYFEHANYLSNRFIQVLKYLHSLFFSNKKEKGKENEIKEIDCEKFKFKFFERGDPNTDILFKHFIIKNDPLGLLRSCLLTGDRPNYSEIKDQIKEAIEKLEMSKELSNSELDNILSLLWKKGILNEYESDYSKILERTIQAWIENSINNTLIKFGNDECVLVNFEIEYATDSLMNLIFLNNKKLQMTHEDSAKYLFEKMKEAGLLKKRKVKETIKVLYNSRFTNRNLGSLKSYLIENSKNRGECGYDFMNECLKSFNPLLIKQD